MRSVTAAAVAALAAFAGPASAAADYRRRLAEIEQRADVEARNRPKASVPGSVRRARARAEKET
jgi:hypothetical protein